MCPSIRRIRKGRVRGEDPQYARPDDVVVAWNRGVDLGFASSALVMASRTLRQQGMDDQGSGNLSGAGGNRYLWSR